MSRSKGTGHHRCPIAIFESPVARWGAKSELPVVGNPTTETGLYESLKRPVRPPSFGTGEAFGFCRRSQADQVAGVMRRISTRIAAACLCGLVCPTRAGLAGDRGSPRPVRSPHPRYLAGDGHSLVHRHGSGGR
jgi:hypothetical protein